MTTTQTAPSRSPIINFATTTKKRATAVTRLRDKLTQASAAFKAASNALSAAEDTVDAAYPEPPACLLISSKANLVLLPNFTPFDNGKKAIPSRAIRDEIASYKTR